jgi:hypothetical protein
MLQYDVVTSNLVPRLNNVETLMVGDGYIWAGDLGKRSCHTETAQCNLSCHRLPAAQGPPKGVCCMTLWIFTLQGRAQGWAAYRARAGARAASCSRRSDGLVRLAGNFSGELKSDGSLHLLVAAVWGCSVARGGQNLGARMDFGEPFH